MELAKQVFYPRVTLPSQTHLHTDILYLDFQLLPGIFFLDCDAIFLESPLLLAFLPGTSFVVCLLSGLCCVLWWRWCLVHTHTHIHTNPQGRKALFLGLGWSLGPPSVLKRIEGAMPAPGRPFLDRYRFLCMLGNMTSEVPLATPRATVRLLPKVCELSWTTLGVKHQYQNGGEGRPKEEEHVLLFVAPTS